MALVVKQTLCVDCGNFVVIDTTGTYDATTNPGGYGTPNPNFGATSPYQAEFWFPQSDTDNPADFTLNLLSNPPAPDADGFYVYTLSPLAFGVDVLPSGIWTVRITFGATITNRTVLAVNDIRQKINECICSTGGKTVNLWADLKAAEILYCGYRNAEAAKMITRLYRQAAECACDDGTEPESGCEGCGG